MSFFIAAGAAGLLGSESLNRSVRDGLKVAGINNNLGQWFFGQEAFTLANRQKFIDEVRKIQGHLPDWKFRCGLQEILKEIHAACRA